MEVLIVDNSAEIIYRFKEMIAELDVIITVYSAYTCMEALGLIKKKKPGIVIIDFNIPGGDSFKCLTEIKKLHKHIIIALVNREDKTAAHQFRLSGVDYFLDKYHEFEKVPEIILSLIKKNK